MYKKTIRNKIMKNTKVVCPFIAILMAIDIKYQINIIMEKLFIFHCFYF